MLRTLAIRVTSQIATRFRLWRQQVSYPVILQSMVRLNKHQAEKLWIFYLKLCRSLLLNLEDFRAGVALHGKAIAPTNKREGGGDFHRQIAQPCYCDMIAISSHLKWPKPMMKQFLQGFCCPNSSIRFQKVQGIVFPSLYLSNFSGRACTRTPLAAIVCSWGPRHLQDGLQFPPSLASKSKARVIVPVLYKFHWGWSHDVRKANYTTV
jgi:hypothetical protein